MKRHGEIMLNLYEFKELYWILENTTRLQVEPMKNKSNEIVGCRWKQLDCNVTLVATSMMENEENLFIGSELNNKDEITKKSEELMSKLFLPWELHLPVYIIVNKIGDYGVDEQSNRSLNALIKSFVRIIMEELKGSVGGWIPSDKGLIFPNNNWDYDVELLHSDDYKDRDLSKFKCIIEQRVLGTNYYVYYL